MNIKCEVVKKISKEGKAYYVIYIADIEKQVFLSPLEVKMLKTLGLKID